MRTTKHLDADQVKRLLKYLDNTQSYDNTLLSILLRSGMRGEELVKVKPEDIDMGHGVLSIRAAKGSNDRVVPIKKSLLESFYNAINNGAVKNTRPSSLKARLRVVLKRALFNSLGVGYSHLSLHSLRASFAIALYNSMDHDILLVKELLGHRQIDSTMHYVNISRLNKNKTKILKAIG